MASVRYPLRFHIQQIHFQCIINESYPTEVGVKIFRVSMNVRTIHNICRQAADHSKLNADYISK